MSSKVRVAVNGFGVIGKRVADAVALQDDMELAGVADVVSDYRIRVAVERGYAVYASLRERRAEMEAAGIPVAGALVWDDALAADDRELYLTFGVHNEYGARSMTKTDTSLGIVKAFLPATTVPIAHQFGPEVPHPAVAAVGAAHAEFMQIGKGAEEPAEPEPTAEPRHGVRP